VRGYFRYEGMAAPPDIYPIEETDNRFFIYDAVTGEALGGGSYNTHLVSTAKPTPTP